MKRFAKILFLLILLVSLVGLISPYIINMEAPLAIIIAGIFAAIILGVLLIKYLFKEIEKALGL